MHTSDFCASSPNFLTWLISFCHPFENFTAAGNFNCSWFVVAFANRWILTPSQSENIETKSVPIGHISTCIWTFWRLSLCIITLFVWKHFHWHLQEESSCCLISVSLKYCDFQSHGSILFYIYSQFFNWLNKPFLTQGTFMVCKKSAFTFGSFCSWCSWSYLTLLCLTSFTCG